MDEQTPPRRKRTGEWTIPPSPKSLETMYLKLREQHDELKNEISILLRRMIDEYGEDDARDFLLEKFPLMKIYDMFMEVLQSIQEENDHKDDVILIPDTSSDSVNK